MHTHANVRARNKDFPRDGVYIKYKYIRKQSKAISCFINIHGYAQICKELSTQYSKPKAN